MTDPFSPAGRFEQRRRDADQQRALEAMSRKPKEVVFVGGPKDGEQMVLRPGQTTVEFQELPGINSIAPRASVPLIRKFRTHRYKEVERGKFCYFGCD